MVPEAPLESTEDGLVPHCPAGTNHTIVGAGDRACLVLAVGARDRSKGPEWGGYPVDEPALRHGAGVEEETAEPPVGVRAVPGTQSQGLRRRLAPRSRVARRAP
ncbi:MAG: hypothetical protein M5U27_04640 [Gaiella sp.]|nr:hypothetical protein [Gaiella sp.]